jgi:hypothetical protein
MSDIEREEFEQAVTERWSDSYSFTRFGDEDYYDEVVEGMWRGWQASRQALEGEPVGTARRCEYDRDITYCEFEADEVPIGTKLYTHPASRQPVSVPEETLTAIHDTLRLVWSRELSADDGMDEIEILIPPTKTDDWIKCSERLPDLGQRVILQSNGVIQNYMPLFDQGDSDFGMGDHFWDFEDINDIDNPLVDFENDSWMPLPKPPKQEKSQ